MFSTKNDVGSDPYAGIHLGSGSSSFAFPFDSGTATKPEKKKSFSDGLTAFLNDEDSSDAGVGGKGKTLNAVVAKKKNSRIAISDDSDTSGASSEPEGGNNFNAPEKPVVNFLPEKPVVNLPEKPPESSQKPVVNLSGFSFQLGGALAARKSSFASNQTDSRGKLSAVQDDVVSEVEEEGGLVVSPSYRSQTSYAADFEDFEEDESILEPKVVSRSARGDRSARRKQLAASEEGPFRSKQESPQESPLSPRSRKATLKPSPRSDTVSGKKSPNSPVTFKVPSKKLSKSVETQTEEGAAGPPLAHGAPHYGCHPPHYQCYYTPSYHHHPYYPPSAFPYDPRNAETHCSPPYAFEPGSRARREGFRAALGRKAAELSEQDSCSYSPGQTTLLKDKDVTLSSSQAEGNSKKNSNSTTGGLTTTLNSTEKSIPGALEHPLVQAMSLVDDNFLAQLEMLKHAAAMQRSKLERLAQQRPNFRYTSSRDVLDMLETQRRRFGMLSMG